MSVTIIPGSDDAAIAAWLQAVLTTALESAGPGGGEQGRIAICLPGGSTPFPILEKLAQSGFDFQRISVWPGDDRLVPEEHSASNTGKLRTLLEPLGATVVPLALGQQPPRFALTWLGMGADGHIASLFPNTDPQTHDAVPIRQLTPDPLPPEAPFDRITLTIPSLVNADQLLFVIRGADKARLFEDAVATRHDLPVARLLWAAQAPVTCFT